MSLSNFPFCIFFANYQNSLGHTDFLSTLFENSYSLASRLVLQNFFHSLIATVVRLFSSQYVFLNFVLWLTASLRSLAINPPAPPPQKKKNNIIVSVFSLLWSCHHSQENNNWFCTFHFFYIASLDKYLIQEEK